MTDNEMKKQWIKYSLLAAGTLTLSLFIGGLVWSLLPVGGSTLPHWVASSIGSSFKGSALLTSVVLGILFVCSISLFSSVESVAFENQK